MSSRVGFSTLLKYLALSSRQRATTISYRFIGRGFPFWDQLGNFCFDALKAGATPEDIKRLLAGFGRESQNRSYIFALTGLQAWAHARGYVPFMPPQQRLYAPLVSGGDIVVDITPVCGLLIHGERYYLQTWATRNPVMKRHPLQCGLEFFRTNMRTLGYRDHKYVIYDVVNGREIREEALPLAIAKSTAHETSNLAHIWKQVEEKYKRPGKDGDRQIPLPL